MRPTRFALLLLAGAGLGGCVPVNDGYYGTPYGAYTGDRRLVTPYVYRGGSDGYLYDQSRRTWQGNYYRPSPYRDYRQYPDRDQNQGNYRNRYNRPTHDNRQND